MTFENFALYFCGFFMAVFIVLSFIPSAYLGQTP